MKEFDQLSALEREVFASMAWNLGMSASDAWELLNTPDGQRHLRSLWDFAKATVALAADFD